MTEAEFFEKILVLKIDRKGPKLPDLTYFCIFLKIASLDFFDILHEVEGQLVLQNGIMG